MFPKKSSTPGIDAVGQMWDSAQRTMIINRANKTAATFEELADIASKRADFAECSADINAGTTNGYYAALETVLKEVADGVAGSSARLSDPNNADRILAFTRQVRAYEFENMIAQPGTRLSSTKTATAGLKNALAKLNETLAAYYSKIPPAHAESMKKMAREALMGIPEGRISQAQKRNPMKR